MAAAPVILHSVSYFTQEMINDINARAPGVMAPYTLPIIRKSYRELSRHLHPDIAAPLGTPPNILAIVNSNFQYLQTARDNLLLDAAAAPGIFGAAAPGGPAPGGPAAAAAAAAAPPNFQFDQGLYEQELRADKEARRRSFLDDPRFIAFLNYYRVPEQSRQNNVILDSWIDDYAEARDFKPLERTFENTAAKIGRMPGRPMAHLASLARIEPYRRTETIPSRRISPNNNHVILTYAAQNPQGRRNFDGLYTYYSSQVLRPLSREEFNNVLIKFIRENRRKDMIDLVGGALNKRSLNKKHSNRKKNKTGKKRLYKRRQTKKRNSGNNGGGRLPVFEKLERGISIPNPEEDRDPNFWLRKGMIDAKGRKIMDNRLDVIDAESRRRQDDQAMSGYDTD